MIVGMALPLMSLAFVLQVARMFYNINQINHIFLLSMAFLIYGCSLNFINITSEIIIPGIVTWMFIILSEVMIAYFHGHIKE